MSSVLHTMGFVTMRLRILPHGEDLPLPAYQSEHAAGLDLMAALGPGEIVTIEPGARALIPAGFALELPAGYEAQIRPRSGLALRHGITVLNSPGAIDADYRGEVKMLLINLGESPFAIRRADRIAQLVVQRVARAKIEVATKLSASPRGGGGFGSTGGGAPPGQDKQ